MKRVIFVFTVLIASISTFGQAPIEESKKISQEEVPAAVLKSYDADFVSPLAQANGVWWIVYTKYNESVQGRLTDKEVFRPIAYIFKGRGKNKGEARYSADGKLESSKGLDRTIPPGQK